MSGIELETKKDLVTKDFFERRLSEETGKTNRIFPLYK